MRARVAVGFGLLPALLTACGGAVKPASSTDALGCGGWFTVSHDTLAAHVQLLGPVRAVAVNALLDDGTTRSTSTPISVSAGTTMSTIHVSRVGGMVVSAAARVLGDSPTAQATCELSTPH
ncbi:MAG TPA: hypothetical protein VFJ17_00705 [Mycobacteriales bacterium]|jgi:hypothetical protein|nr:hypothetical protein [Mycobacteriales bacterium]